ncbi:hypothetical protein CDV31_003667 [Fusarium ambrosium]|nr:hypothetical protein CDV31_003667 [Fusarium ambrosium]
MPCRWRLTSFHMPSTPSCIAVVTATPQSSQSLFVAQSITQASTPQWHTTAQCHSEGDILVEAFWVLHQRY